MSSTFFSTTSFAAAAAAASSVRAPREPTLRRKDLEPRRKTNDVEAQSTSDYMGGPRSNGDGSAQAQSSGICLAGSGTRGPSKATSSLNSVLEERPRPNSTPGERPCARDPTRPPSARSARRYGQRRSAPETSVSCLSIPQSLTTPVRSSGLLPVRLSHRQPGQ